jgi:hypothetical protein
MKSLVGALRLPHWIGLGLVVAALGGGLPSNWYGLVSEKVSEVERLRACLQRHSVDATPSARKHLVHAAEKRGDLKRRQANAVVACAHTVVAR